MQVRYCCTRARTAIHSYPAPNMSTFWTRPWVRFALLFKAPVCSCCIDPSIEFAPCSARLAQGTALRICVQRSQVQYAAAPPSDSGGVDAVCALARLPQQRALQTSGSQSSERPLRALVIMTPGGLVCEFQDAGRGERWLFAWIPAQRANVVAWANPALTAQLAQASADMQCNMKIAPCSARHHLLWTSTGSHEVEPTCTPPPNTPSA